MPLSEIELKRCESDLSEFMAKRRPPLQIRDKVDIAYRIKGQTVEIFEIRPHYEDRSQKVEQPIAKTTFIRTKNRWKVFWMRSDLKWHGYEPNLEVRTFKEFIDVIDRDEHGCFFG